VSPAAHHGRRSLGGVYGSPLQKSKRTAPGLGPAPDRRGAHIGPSKGVSGAGQTYTGVLAAARFSAPLAIAEHPIVPIVQATGRGFELRRIGAVQTGNVIIRNADNLGGKDLS